MLVVSLTSIPPRFGQLPRVVANLLDQADRVIVTLPLEYRRFPGTHDIPDLPGADVLRPAVDHGPAAKVIHAAQALRGKDVNLLYCDDDWAYSPGWAQKFLDRRAAHSGAVLAGSIYGAERLRMSGPPVAQGFAGVMIHPDWLDEAALNPPPEAWGVDDIWLSGAYGRMGRCVVEVEDARQLASPLEDPECLQDARVEGQTRAGLNRACLDVLNRRYGTWQET